MRNLTAISGHWKMCVVMEECGTYLGHKAR